MPPNCSAVRNRFGGALDADGRKTFEVAFYPALLMLGGGLLAFYYSTFIENISDPSVPLILATGPPATGKTTGKQYMMFTSCKH